MFPWLNNSESLWTKYSTSCKNKEFLYFLAHIWFIFFKRNMNIILASCVLAVLCSVASASKILLIDFSFEKLLSKFFFYSNDSTYILILFQSPRYFMRKLHSKFFLFCTQFWFYTYLPIQYIFCPLNRISPI